MFWIKRKRENDVLYFSNFGKRFVGYLEKKPELTRIKIRVAWNKSLNLLEWAFRLD